ncbi:MAG: hypothetical protein QOF10_4801 [Kribbellaceae bacterium]|nr:hypothetical protein [Kribbellaceae bacterium]
MISVNIETSVEDQVLMVCDSAECDGRETEHDAKTIAYWETPDSGTIVSRTSCRDCNQTKAVQQWVGPPRRPSHDCGYYTDDSGVCSYCHC